MKLFSPRTFFLVASALSAASSHAQSTVTIYGVVDEYLQAGHSSVGTTTKLESGGESGSRIGFKGQEELGGGLKAVFTLESGLAADTGTITQGGVMWGRQAFVGLSSTTLGALTLGRQYNLNYVEIDAGDPFGTGLGGLYASGIMSVVGGARVNNSVTYAAPVFGGVQATLFGALGEGTTGKQYAGDLRYSAGPLTLGANYVRKDAFGAQTDASSALVSAAYDFGPVKLVGQVQQVKNLTQVLNRNDDRLEYFLGAQMPFGPHRLSAMIGSGKTKDVANTRATQLSVGYQYAMSKRTDLYAIASDIKNDSAANYTTSGATGVGPTNVAGHDVRSVSFGIRHRF
jgi:predicted porin